jgi:murein DD-endopeptidase MepM/ murein hydrolase activator NlpD
MAKEMLEAKGHSPEDAAAIVGSLMQESMNPRTKDIDPEMVNSIGAYGIAQWMGPRRAQLEKRSKHNTLQAQIDFLDWELKNTEKPAMRALRAAKDLTSKVVAFTRRFERPGKKEERIEQRIAYAEAAYNSAGFDAGSRSIGPGSRGEDVSALQQSLKSLGYDPGPIDGVRGSKTAKAVRDFQRDQGLKIDGVAGPATMGRLSDPAMASGTPAPSRNAPSSFQLEAFPLDDPGARYTSGFGMRTHPVTGRKAMHEGVDIAGAKPGARGVNVVAAAGGTVVKAGTRQGWGNSVTIEHPSGHRTQYNHLDRIGVKVGDKVSARTPIGKMGSSGAGTNVHLDFNVIDPQEAKRPGGNKRGYVDPHSYLSAVAAMPASPKGKPTIGALKEVAPPHIGPAYAWGATSANSLGTTPSARADTSVAGLQQSLAQAGFSPGAIDGIMGSRTRAAIQAAEKAGYTIAGSSITPARGLPDAPMPTARPAGLLDTPATAARTLQGYATQLAEPKQASVQSLFGAPLDDLPDLKGQIEGRPAGYDPQVAAAQRELASLGLNPGPVDGLLGPRTQAAMAAHERTKSTPMPQSRAEAFAVPTPQSRASALGVPNAPSYSSALAQEISEFNKTMGIPEQRQAVPVSPQYAAVAPAGLLSDPVAQAPISPNRPPLSRYEDIFGQRPPGQLPTVANQNVPTPQARPAGLPTIAPSVPTPTARPSGLSAASVPWGGRPGYDASWAAAATEQAQRAAAAQRAAPQMAGPFNGARMAGAAIGGIALGPVGAALGYAAGPAIGRQVNEARSRSEPFGGLLGAVTSGVDVDPNLPWAGDWKGARGLLGSEPPPDVFDGLLGGGSSIGGRDAYGGLDAAIDAGVDVDYGLGWSDEWGGSRRGGRGGKGGRGGGRSGGRMGGGHDDRF